MKRFQVIFKPSRKWTRLLFGDNHLEKLFQLAAYYMDHRFNRAIWPEGEKRLHAPDRHPARLGTLSLRK